MNEIVYQGEASPAANVLASRYATPEIQSLFSDEGRVYGERALLIMTMEEQARLGLPISQETIDDYKRVQGEIDLDTIRQHELKSKHDVNARNRAFNELAGHEDVMKGYTSRDLTEAYEQFQILSALNVIRERTVATLARFGERALDYGAIAMAGRSHNVAAQTITLGKRFSNAGEEMLYHFGVLNRLIDNYPWRGIKGPVGTQQDMLDLFEGDRDKVELFEQRMAKRLGFSAIWGSTGQVYPRSLDEQVVSALHGLSSGPSNFATTLRSMAGYELMTEGFGKDQKGSNAMPHKMNARTSERITGLGKVIAGNLDMVSRLVGDQWNEGDVSDSVVRRVAIPDTFYAMDGLLEATMHVLDECGAYPAIIERELSRYLPFLTTTKVLMAAVKAGMGRETAHSIIGEHARAVVTSMREQGQTENDLFDRVDSDERLPVTKDELEVITKNPLELTGMAETQVAKFVSTVEDLVTQHPEAAAYDPRELL